MEDDDVLVLVLRLHGLCGCCRCWYIKLVWIVLAARCAAMVAAFVLVVGLLGVVNASTLSYARGCISFSEAVHCFDVVVVVLLCHCYCLLLLLLCCCWLVDVRCHCLILLPPPLLAVWRSLRCILLPIANRIAQAAVVGLRCHICAYVRLNTTSDFCYISLAILPYAFACVLVYAMHWRSMIHP